MMDNEDCFDFCTGVDDGQFARILNFEIPQIKAAFRGRFLLDEILCLSRRGFF